MTTIYLLDTNAVSDAMMDHPKVKARMTSQPAGLITSVIVCGEIRYGLERLPAGKRRTDLKVKADRVLGALPCEPVPAPAADNYAAIRHAVEGKGLSIDDNDLWIAATALTLNVIVVTRDREFAHIPGLHVEDWTQ